MEFIEFLAKSGAIKFGEFTLKSGRLSPYFISTGVISDGYSSYELGKHFARKINESYGQNGFDAIYGPAYKGIPLAVSVSIAFHKEMGINKPWLFDRKEKKIYGDASAFVGASLDKGARVIIVDDVFTTGATKLEAIEKLEKGLGVGVAGLTIAVDRQERGRKLGSVEEFTNDTGLRVDSITTITDVFEHLKNRSIGGTVYVDDGIYRSFLEYRRRYGV